MQVYKNYYIYLICLICISFGLMAGPRYDAQGGVYTVSNLPCDGPGGNPAAIAGLRNEHIIAAHATRYWLGLPGDVLYSSRLAYTMPTYKWGALGMEFRQFGLGLQSSFAFGLGYAYPIRIDSRSNLSIGFFGRWIRNQYDLADSYRFEDDPLFNQYGDAADGIGLDVGTKYDIGSSFSVGLTAENLVKPNLSLSGESEDGNAEPMEISLGLAYAPVEWFIPAIQGSWDEYEGIQGAIGAEFLFFDGLIGLRMGYREGGITCGLGVNGMSALPLTFDYALDYPDGALSKAGATTHSVGITASIKRSEKKPEPERLKWTDLIALRLPDEEDTLIIGLDEESSFKATILNTGTMTAKDFFVSAYGLTPERTPIGKPVFVDSLAPGEKIPVSWPIVPTKGGSFNMEILADSDTANFADTTGIIEELNEANNRVTIPYYVAGEIIASIDIEHKDLEINELTYIAEEEPLVPVIFFSEDATEVTDRFKPTLQTLATRLADNPDIVMGLYGFVDIESDPESWADDELHVQRARAVKQKLIELGAPDTSIIIISDGYTITGSRSGTGANFESAQDRLWVQEENRRVEMHSWVRDYLEPIISVDFAGGDLEISATTRDSLSMFACEANIFLEANPDVALVLEGSTSDEHDFSEVYNFLDELRTYILEEITCPIDDTRFPIIVDRGDSMETTAKLLVSGEAVIFRPRENALAAKDYEIPDNMEENKVAISIISGRVEEYEVLIVDSNGKRVNTLSEGAGIPPKLLYWDWKDLNGNLVDPHMTYHVDLVTVDPAEGVSRFSSEEMEIIVTGIEKREESAIIVQFAFDEVTSTSKYLESRLEAMAWQVKEIAEKPGNTLTVKIIGHTDPIGTDRRNLILSQERAAKEENNFRRYLRYVVEVDSDAELDRWLAEHNATLIRQGAADNEAYEIERYRDGEFEKVLLGNNAFPEGRSVNRRVIIQFEETSEK